VEFTGLSGTGAVTVTNVLDEDDMTSDSPTALVTQQSVKTYVDFNFPSKTGTGASGTWGIAISGNAATATKLATARTIGLSGDVSGSASFDGSGNATITATVANDSHTHGDSTINGLDASAITTGTLTRPTSSSSASCTGNAATATSLAGGIASQVPYQSASGVTAFVTNGTAGQVLISNGTSAPAWRNIDGGTF